MATAEPVYVGIDVSLDTLDIAYWPSRKHVRIANTEAALTPYIAQFTQDQVALVVFEPTNHYHDLLVGLLAAAEVPLSQADAGLARHYAKSVRMKAKTDKQDALLLARYATQLTPTALADADTAALCALVTRRRHAVKIRTMEKTRRHGATGDALAEIDEAIALYEKFVTGADRAITAFIASHPVFAARDALLQSAKGVGPVVSATVLAELPELATASRRQLAALVGVAPYDKASGKRQGKAKCWGGRAELRAVLYEGTLAAIRSNSRIRPFYQRLIAAGKLHRVAVIACLRKFLTILRAMVQQGEPFHPAIQQAA